MRVIRRNERLIVIRRELCKLVLIWEGRHIKSRHHEGRLALDIRWLSQDLGS